MYARMHGWLIECMRRCMVGLFLCISRCSSLARTCADQCARIIALQARCLLLVIACSQPAFVGCALTGVACSRFIRGAVAPSLAALRPLLLSLFAASFAALRQPLLAACRGLLVLAALRQPLLADPRASLADRSSRHGPRKICLYPWSLPFSALHICLYRQEYLYICI